MIKALIEESRGRRADVVVDGSTFEDESDFRPGSRALAGSGVESPLKELGFAKADVMAALADAGQVPRTLASGACLASRIPYGDPITGRKLEMIEEAEDFIRDLGFDTVRVRCHGLAARIEIDADRICDIAGKDFREKVCERLAELGFSRVALDLRGYRTGSLNEELDEETVTKALGRGMKPNSEEERP
jgi:uncharacterized protein